MTDPIFEITKSATFDAAHRLPGGPPGRYTRLHGHSFQVEATLRGPATAPVGWVEDLGRLDTALRGAAASLDHSLLNDHAGLENPTLEALCLHFADRFARTLSDAAAHCRLAAHGGRALRAGPRLNRVAASAGARGIP